MQRLGLSAALLIGCGRLGWSIEYAFDRDGDIDYDATCRQTCRRYSGSTKSCVEKIKTDLELQTHCRRYYRVTLEEDERATRAAVGRLRFPEREPRQRLPSNR